MPDYTTTKGGGIAYSTTSPSSKADRGIPTTPPMSEAQRDYNAQPKSKAIKLPGGGYGGSTDKARND